jgi:hypothetical protein
MHKFNVCDIKALEDHFHSDMFRWHIYYHHQGERVHTESWDATGEKKPLLLFTHCQSHSTEADSTDGAVYVLRKSPFAVCIQRRP